MKKNYLLSVLIVLISSIVSIFAQTIDCYDVNTPPEYNCGPWSNEITDYNVQIPYYQGCTIYLTYKYRTCTVINFNCPPGNEKIIFQIKPISISWGGDCDDLLYDVYPGWPNDFSNADPLVIAEMMKTATSMIELRLFEEYYNALSPQLQAEMQCEGNPCSLPDIDGCFAQSFYSMPHCVSFCHAPYYENGVRRIRATWKSCSIEPLPCCTFYRSYCYCPATGSILVTEELSNDIQFDCTHLEQPWGDSCGAIGTGQEDLYRTECVSICDETLR